MREQIRANRQNHLLSENEAEANVLHFLYTQDVKRVVDIPCASVDLIRCCRLRLVQSVIHMLPSLNNNTSYRSH